MYITEIIIGKIKLPLLKPYISALRTVEYIEDIVVIIKTNNGVLGYGSATPTTALTGESYGSIVYALSEILSPQLIGKNIADFNKLIHLINNALERNTSAKAAVEIALYDLFAKNCNLPLYQLLGGVYQEINTGMTLGLKHIDELIGDATYFTNQGFTNLKIKTGAKGGIDEDLERVTAVRRIVGQDVTICIDANQSWSVKQSLKIIKKFEAQNLNVAMVEQPIKAYDLEGLKFLRDNLETEIYVDEGCSSPCDAMKIINHNMADGIVIKLMKAGGIYNAINLFDMAIQHNVSCVACCMMESPISLTAMASLAVGRKVKYVDLAPLKMIKQNPITGGASLDGSKIVLSKDAGLGISSLGDIDILYKLK